MTQHDDEVPAGEIIDVRSPVGPDEPNIESIDRMRTNETRRRVPGWVLIAPAVVLLGLIGLLLFGSINDADDTPGQLAFTDQTAVSTTSTAPAPAPAPPITAASTPPTTATPTTVEPAPPTTVAAPPTTVPAPPAQGGEMVERGAIYRDGKLYLEGAVPSAEVAEAFVEKAAAVIGPDNVVNNYVIDPTAPIPTDGRVTVDEPFLFATNSADLSPDYTSILDLGVAVMNLNPNVTMVVIGHTDGIGTPRDNRVLSRKRAREVVEYMAWRAIDRSRFEVVGMGESEPIASNKTAEGRAQNRRIEVELVGLLSD